MLIHYEQRQEKSGTHRNSNLIDTPTDHYRSDYGGKIKEEQSRNYDCDRAVYMYKHDGLPLNLAISLQIDQLYKSSRCGFFLEKLLARQSCADSWRQHIKGLCGSVVSINGLSFLLSGSSTRLHHYDGAPSYRAPGQTFIGNGIGFKQRYYSYSQHQRWTVSVSCHTY